MNPDNSFSCYLMSVMTLNIFNLRKYRLTFEFCHYFILVAQSVGENRQKPVFCGL